jgi:hypothetical protein
MSFDPMAAAIDWLDAYRAGETEALLRMYAQHSVICCGCRGLKNIGGSEGRQAYWTERLVKYPAAQLADIQPAAADGVLISYGVRESVVSTVLRFDANGRIASHTCGPAD